MGDEVLKTLTTVVTVLLLIFSFANSKENMSEELKNKITEYDKFFTEINQKRVGVSNFEIDKISNPFKVTREERVFKNSSKKEKTHLLTAIFNKNAKIDGQWYKINNAIGGFKLIAINSGSVIIKNAHSKKELFIRKNNVKKIKFSSK